MISLWIGSFDVYYGTRVNFCPRLTFLPVFFPHDKNTPPVFFPPLKNLNDPTQCCCHTSPTKGPYNRKMVYLELVCCPLTMHVRTGSLFFKFHLKLVP